MWALRYGLGLRPKVIPDPLEFGSIFHKGLEVWWSHLDKPGVVRVTLAIAAVKEEIESRRSDQQSPFSTEAIFATDPKLDDWQDLMSDMLWRYDLEWESEIPKYKLLCNEQTIEAATQTPSGTRSPWARYSGVLDKAVEDEHGQVWIWDHKTTTSALSAWRARNIYSPQALTYGWLFREMTGVTPVGIIYDLCRKSKPASIAQYKVLKDKSALYKTMPKDASADGFKAAIAALGQTIDSVSWYRGQLEHLENRAKGQFFARVPVRWDYVALDRVGAELYATATDLRRAHDITREKRTDLLQCGEFWRAIAPEHINALAYLFTRQNSCFNQYGRTCSYLDVCRVASSKEQMSYLLEDYRLSDQIHEETTIKQENEQSCS
jgi:hypothetical protein